MTLVEVIIATALIAIGVLVVFAVAAQTAMFSERSDRGYDATNIAMNRIEALKRLDFDMLQFTEETDLRVGSDGNASQDGKFFRTTEITASYNGDPSLIKIKVTVREIKVNADGTLPGTQVYQGVPIVFETLIVDI